MFSQVQSVGTFDHGRFALGPQVNYHIVGLELGGAIETGSDQYAATASVHIAPFLSAGFASAAFRIGIPVAALTENGGTYPTDLGLVMTLKWPYPLHGRTRSVLDVL